MQLHAVLDAARGHHAELTFIAENLPQYLPGQAARPSGELLHAIQAAPMSRIAIR